MEHQPQSSAHEQLTSSASASQYPAQYHEFNPATFDARLDAIPDDTPFQISDEAFRHFYGRVDFWAINNPIMGEDTILGDAYVPQYEPETQELVNLLQEAGSHEQIQDHDELPVAQEQIQVVKLQTEEQHKAGITPSYDDQGLSEQQNTELERPSSWNPYSDDYVDHHFAQSPMVKKRKNDEPERGDVAKKHHFQYANAFLPSPPPSSSKFPVVQADAGDQQAFYMAVLPIDQARFFTAEGKFHVEPSRYLYPVADQNSPQMGPRYNVASPLYHNAYAPPPSPHYLQPASSYPGHGPGSSFPGYVAPLPADYAAVSPYTSYAPASLTDPPALQYNPQPALQPAISAPKAKLPAQKKTRAPAKKAKTVPKSDSTLFLQNITRGIQNRTTEVLYQAALDIKQSIHEWHNERDRLEVIMQKRLADYDDTKANGPGNQKYSPKEREVRKTLMSRIRAFEKKFDMVNAELMKRGVSVPI
ncbi:hypothetical protein PMIN06_009834 [Paraphaeosphaeria minitans]|uniref:Uncharacterized protein n=1 Tax=Paraphaeosphaeria minitans TaxID=565426 RepID=A0A9P6G5N3_9PLEO|nr:hypothetical protein PMIN01_12987 [Paraphaeosphaeria minitans]